jgi:glycerol-3-phosphate acyltransferase PlsY
MKYFLIFIIVLYFANYHICEYFFANDIDNFFRLKYIIYTIIIALCLKYKDKNSIIEDFFFATLLNNAWALFQNENHYSVNDLIFIITYTTLLYVFRHKRNYRSIINRINNFFYNFDKKK